MPQLMQSVNEFASRCRGRAEQDVAQARSYAQSFTSIFGRQVAAVVHRPGPFRCPGRSDHTGCRGDAHCRRPARERSRRAVLAEKHGPKKPGATGVAIYFPNSQLYSSPVAGPQSYTAIAQRFAGQSLWDDFLAFHYTGRRFEPGAPRRPCPSARPPSPRPAPARSPSRPSGSRPTAVAPGRPITMRADVTGANVGYVYFFTGYLDKACQLDQRRRHGLPGEPADAGAQRRLLSRLGRTHKFTLQFDWEPLMFAITDGRPPPRCCCSPQSYGAAPEQAVYTVDGIYTYAERRDP